MSCTHEKGKETKGTDGLSAESSQNHDARCRDGGEDTKNIAQALGERGPST